MDFREWGAAQQLTQETISILIDNGVDSRTALTAEDLPALGLKLGQMALVRRLINAEPTASTTTGAPAHHNLSDCFSQRATRYAARSLLTLGQQKRCMRCQTVG